MSRLRKEVEAWDPKNPGTILVFSKRWNHTCSPPTFHSLCKSKKRAKEGQWAVPNGGRVLRLGAWPRARLPGGSWLRGRGRAEASCLRLRNRSLTPEVPALWELSSWTAAAVAAAVQRRQWSRRGECVAGPCRMWGIGPGKGRSRALRGLGPPCLHGRAKSYTAPGAASRPVPPTPPPTPAQLGRQSLESRIRGSARE